MSASNFTENPVLDFILGSGHGASFGSTVYVALYTATPNDAGGGTECTGGSYARVAVTNNDTNWPAAASGSKSNGTRIDFPTATGSWGTVTSWGILSASSGGTLYLYGTFTTSRAVSSGDAPFLAVGGLTITCD